MAPRPLWSRPRRPRPAQRAVACLAAALVALAGIAPAAADTRVQVRHEVESWSGWRTSDASLQLSRLSYSPTLKVQTEGPWRFEAGLNLLVADDDVGLGRFDGFSSASKPLAQGENAALTLERAVLIHRTEHTELTLGKQTVAWGSLDGLQGVDRFDPQRRVDFVLSDPRPERLSRWGARLKLNGRESTLDIAVALDPSVSQLPDDTGALLPRGLRGPPSPGAGVPGTGGQAVGVTLGRGATGLPTVQSDRDDYLGDATYGVRYERRFQGLTVGALALSGPDTEPLTRLEVSPSGPALQFDYLRRTVWGASVEKPLGGQILRLEAALIPDQPVTLAGPGAPATDTRRRSLLGAGVDWDAPGDVFVNAQLLLDHVDQADHPTRRAELEAFGTLALQRSFRNDVLRGKLDLAASLTDGDVLVRPSLSWQVNDTVGISTGADIFLGDREGAFGQYRDESRAWLKVTAVF